MKFGPVLGMAIAFALFGGPSGYADDSAPAAPQPVATTQLASVNTVAPVAASTATDPLHADPRWPLFANCIDNTATPDAFQACLQMAFTGVGPSDQVLALLDR